jgi:hypothetical protein
LGRKISFRKSFIVRTDILAVLGPGVHQISSVKRECDAIQIF